MRISLRVTAGPFKGQVFTFMGHDTFIVGRSKQAHFRLAAKDRFFSRIHFMVELNPPHCRLMDMGSRNGTFVNDQKVAMVDLQDGDKIRAGRTILRVAVEGPPAGVSPTPPPHPSPGPVALPKADAPKMRTVPSAAGTEPLGTFRTLNPFHQSGSKAPLPVPRQVCLGCEGSLAPSNPTLPEGDRTEPSTTLLCPVCQEQVSVHPQPFSGYQVVRQLGRGGMGVVHLAIRTADSTPVALKAIIPAVAGTRADIERFFREAAILGQLNHPRIVGFRDMGEVEGQLYFVMDYVKGIDARRLLEQRGPLPIHWAVGLIGQVLEALEYAHAQGFVHRDIKPANVLIAQENGRESVKLADFGLARTYQASNLSGLTLQGDLGGTLGFMAPEQVTNFREAQPPADQYAAAATLYTLLTDRLVYDLPRYLHEQILMILEKEPVPIQVRRPEVPKELAAVLHRALAREPQERFADVKTMRLALQPYDNGDGHK